MKRTISTLVLLIAFQGYAAGMMPFSEDSVSIDQVVESQEIKASETAPVENVTASEEPGVARTSPEQLDKELQAYFSTVEMLSRYPENLSSYLVKIESLEKEISEMLMNEIDFGVQTLYRRKLNGDSAEAINSTFAWTQEWMEKLERVALASGHFKNLASEVQKAPVFSETVGTTPGAEQNQAAAPEPASQYTISDRGRQQMENVVKHAMARHRGASRGYCFNAVWGYLSGSGYGNIRAWGDLPRMKSGLARYFADYMNAGQANLNEAGLQRLDTMLTPPLTNPHDARIPVGAVIVVAAGSTGTSDPVAGDIVIKGNGRFINDGPDMWYGTSDTWRGKLLGVYVPK